MSEADEYKNASDQAFKEWESEAPDYRFECEVFEGGFSKAWQRQQSRVKELESQLAEAKKDQARYQYVLLKVGAQRFDSGYKLAFTIRSLPPAPDNVFVGSVAQHFSDAIDAAIAPNQEKSNG